MIDVDRCDTHATIRISGRFDYHCLKQFHAAVAAQDAPRWVVDLGEVDYIDSSALGMLLLLRERAGNDGSRVRLARASGQARDVLLLAKFERMFELEP